MKFHLWAWQRGGLGGVLSCCRQRRAAIPPENPAWPAHAATISGRRYRVVIESQAIRSMARAQSLPHRPKRTTPLTLDIVRAKWAAMRVSGETPGTALHHACYCVLDYFFGIEWLRNHVLIGCRYPGYLMNNPIVQADGMGVDKDHTLRVVQLAELLYNLQGIPGLDHCLDRMFSGQIEPTVAELDFGMFLRRQGAVFSYVAPTGVKGRDYDVDVLYEGGTVACGDIKCKIEGTDYTESSLLNSLKKAQKQFPSDRPGIIFVKVPQRWVDLSTGNLGVETDVSETLAKFFQATKRVVLVVFYTKFTFDGPRGTEIRHVALERENPQSQYARDRSWRLFEEVKEAPDWVNFTRLMR
jgi:hypothetical protein